MISSNAGVFIVPAFLGRGAPFGDRYARGTILGITRGTGRAHKGRAALESIACQTRDVLECREKDSGIKLKELGSDGGSAANGFLMQFQADLLGVPVSIQKRTETRVWRQPISQAWQRAFGRTRAKRSRISKSGKNIFLRCLPSSESHATGKGRRPRKGRRGERKNKVRISRREE